MFGLFSDIFACRDNFLSRTDPRTKLILALLAILGVVSSTNAGFPLVILVFCLATILALRLPFRLIAARLTAPMGAALILVALQSVMTGATPLWMFNACGWKITVTHEGLRTGLLMGARVLGAVSVVLLLSCVTPAHRIFHSLRWCRIPRDWVEIAILMYRYTFTLLDLVVDMTEAQKLRLGYSGMKRSLSSMGIVTGTVFIRSMDQAIRAHEAMVLRGYRGQIPSAPMPALSRNDLWNMGLGGWLLACAYILFERNLT